MGDGVPTGGATSELAEGRSSCEVALATTSTVTVWSENDESVAPVSRTGSLAAAVFSKVTSRVRDATPLGVEAWLVSVS